MLKGANFKFDESFIAGSVSVKMNNFRFLLFSIVTSLLADEMVQSSVEMIWIPPERAEIINLDLVQLISFAEWFGLNMWIVLLERFWSRRSWLISEPGGKIDSWLDWFSIENTIMGLV